MHRPKLYQRSLIVISRSKIHEPWFQYSTELDYRERIADRNPEKRQPAVYLRSFLPLHFLFSPRDDLLICLLPSLPALPRFPYFCSARYWSQWRAPDRSILSLSLSLFLSLSLSFLRARYTEYYCHSCLPQQNKVPSRNSVHSASTSIYTRIMVNTSGRSPSLLSLLLLLKHGVISTANRRYLGSDRVRRHSSSRFQIKFSRTTFLLPRHIILFQANKSRVRRYILDVNAIRSWEGTKGKRAFFYPSLLPASLRTRPRGVNKISMKNCAFTASRNITSRAIFLIFILKLHTTLPSCFTRVSTCLPPPRLRTSCHRNKRRVEKCIKIIAWAKAVV